MRRGGDSALKLADIDRAEWNDFTLRGARSTWLYLWAGDDEAKIEINDRGDSKDRPEALRLMIAVCETLEDVNPQIRIRTDGGDVWRRAMFIIFAVFAGLGLFGFAAAAAGKFGSDGFGLLIGGVGALAGGWLAWSFAPWRTGVYASPSELATLIRGEPRSD